MAEQFLYTFLILFVVSCVLQLGAIKGKEMLAQIAGYSLVGVILSGVAAVWGL